MSLIKIVLPFIAACAFSTASGQDAGATPQVSDTTISVKVKGITCAADLRTLSASVKDVKGVSSCTPGKAGAVSIFKISYDPSVAATKEIFAAIEDTPGCEDPADRPYKVKN